MRIRFRKRELIAIATGTIIGLLFPLPFFADLAEKVAEGCAGCWSGYGPGDERFNKPLADLRILYEKEGRASLPGLRDALKTNPDALVRLRAATYIAELKDFDSVPLLEEILSELFKRVSFSTFGVGSPDFQVRLKVAHVLANLGPTKMADRIWERYNRLAIQRKTEVPYLLNALGDPRLTERLKEILNPGEDHQLMLGALDVLAMGGGVEAQPFLRSKIVEWANKGTEVPPSAGPDGQPIFYSVLRIRAEQAILQINDRNKRASQPKSSFIAILLSIC
jgi:hypothetical protein